MQFIQLTRVQDDTQIYISVAQIQSFGNANETQTQIQFTSGATVQVTQSTEVVATTIANAGQ